MTTSNPIKSASAIALLLFIIPLASCSIVNTIPPEVNLMRLDVQDVTLSHVNLMADLRIFNPNESAFTIQGVDYTLYIEGSKVFSGRNYQVLAVEPQEYGFLTLRLSSAFWDIIQLLNRVPDRTEVAFSMQGSIRLGENRIFARRFSFAKEGVIPLQKSRP